VSQAYDRGLERRDRERRLLRPLGWAFIAIVVTASLQIQPAPGLTGLRLVISLVLVLEVAAVLAATSSLASRGERTQLAVIAVLGGCGVALAALQPHGAVALAATMAVWIAAVRLPPVPAAVTAAAITVALAVTIALTVQPAAQAVLAVTLLMVLLAVTGQFIRRGRESQDHTELLLAQLEDARQAEAVAAALAERARIAGELHDVLAHALSGLAIQLQGARKLAAREQVSSALLASIERSGHLAREGLAEARQAVGALRGDRLPGLDQLGQLVEDFRRDTGAVTFIRVEGDSRPIATDADLALFRGVQEALTNSARYARGAVVEVRLRYGASNTVLTVEDHSPPAPCGGSQLSDQELFEHCGDGHGLQSMRERAQRVGGSAQAGPTADGWRVEIEVPS
jgi:signal transduction histidine kinase